MNAPLNITSLSIDTLGELLAKIDELEKQADAIKDSLKDISTSSTDAQKVFDGVLFRATVVESNPKKTNWDAIKKELNIPQAIIDKHTTTTARFAVRTTSK